MILKYNKILENYDLDNENLNYDKNFEEAMVKQDLKVLLQILMVIKK